VNDIVLKQLANREYHAGGVVLNGVEYGASGKTPAEAFRLLFGLIKKHEPTWHPPILTWLAAPGHRGRTA
jgi:hypothetical protein